MKSSALAFALAFAGFGAACFAAPEPQFFPPPPPSAPVVFLAGTDTYACEAGEPAMKASELIAFGKRHDARGPIDWNSYELPKALGSYFAELPSDSRIETGRVSVVVALSAKGEVLDLVVECSTDSSLNTQALAAYSKMQFTPARMAGVAIPDTYHGSLWFKKP